MIPALAAIATAIALGYAAHWLWRIEHAQDDIEENIMDTHALREQVTSALQQAILGTTDGDLLTAGELPVDEIARLIEERGTVAVLSAGLTSAIDALHGEAALWSKDSPVQSGLGLAIGVLEAHLVLATREVEPA